MLTKINTYIIIQRYPNNNIWEEGWKLNGKFHRDGDLPAYICYYENGTIKMQSWYQNNAWHRNGDLPACVQYYENGDIKMQSWSQNGRLHRDTGPAIFDSKIDDVNSWYLFGVNVSEKTVMCPSELTLNDVIRECNSEARRIMIERMGIEKYISLSNSSVIDVDSHKFNGTRSLMKTSHGTWLVCACPSTGRVYYMEVPLWAKNCEEADQYLRGQVSGQIIGAS